MGSGSDEQELGFSKLADKYPDLLGVRIGFDDTLARKIFAGTDFFLMPSRFEPCGLAQQYAMRYLVERDYTLLQPPYFMNQSVMGGVAQLAEFNETLYHVTGANKEKNEEQIIKVLSFIHSHLAESISLLLAPVK